MSSKYSLSMVFPAYNEEDNLDRLIRDADRVCKDVVEDYEIVIVDDGSVDRTPEILETLKKEFPNCRFSCRICHTNRCRREKEQTIMK